MTAKAYMARSLNVPDSREYQNFVQSLRRLDVEVIDPKELDIPREDYKHRYLWCLESVREAQLLILDAVEPLGLGAGAEAMLAKQLGIPVLAICPEGSHYRSRGGWVHPFVSGLADRMVDCYDDCLKEVQVLANGCGVTNMRIRS